MAGASWNRSLTLPSFGKGKAKGAKTGKGGRGANRPNPIFLVFLGVVVLAAIVHFAMPSLLGGGGSVAPFTPSGVQLHLVARGQTTLGTGPAGSAGAVTRTARDPFAAPVGYALAR